MTIRLHVDAVGFAAPGLDDADALRAHLDGAPLEIPQDWQPRADCLPSRQARRLSGATRLALMAAEQIGDAVPKDGAWVFASSSGEGRTLDAILRALSEPEVLIQPLRFQNAVHNAAHGQWSICAGSTGPGTSIAAYDDTVGAGLLKAAMQVALEGLPTGLVIFDAPLPPPLHEKRPMAAPMAAALALGPDMTERTLAALEIRVSASGEHDSETVPQRLEALQKTGNPVRFAVPLLQQIFRPGRAPVSLRVGEGFGLDVMVRDANDVA